MSNDLLRLNKQLALLLGASRRHADDLIAAGRVSVNSTVAVIGARITIDDEITVDGKPVTTDIKKQYIAMHKPKGYVCSRRRQGDSPTIYDLLPADLHALKPVGRLDRDSSGILLLSNDGDFAFEMTHPKFIKTKIYQVSLDQPLAPLHQQMISDYGVTLEDGISKLSLERRSDDRSRWTVTMHEGRNRQIRRTFAALGYSVTSLHRTKFGNYSLDTLSSGSYTEVKLI